MQLICDTVVESGKRIRCLQYASHGMYVVGVIGSERVGVWRVGSWKRERDWDIGQIVDHVHWHPTKPWLLVAALDGVHVWHTGRGVWLRRDTLHRSVHVEWFPNGRRYICVGYAGDVEIHVRLNCGMMESRRRVGDVW
jgi:hypothetical protein